MQPTIIQGGMGVGVSSWQLARAVAGYGQLGVVSGTALAVTLARRLNAGDPGGHIGRALERFPVPEVAERVRDRYLRDDPGQRKPRFGGVARPTVEPGVPLTELTVVANFVEVWLAKEGTDGIVGINYLEKIQLPTLPSLYGAMLAGVDHVLMGAGIPARIPAILDELALHRDVSMPITVADDAAGSRVEVTFSPTTLLAGTNLPPLHRPTFLAIVASATLATFLARNAAGSPDGFVIETPTAGGHNAPPRGRLKLDASGEPVYGVRDRIDTQAIDALGLPFWLAGGYATRDQLVAAKAAGATGVQVGTAFAFCDESGLDPQLKQQVLDEVRAGTAAIRTDPTASPTGFPFKIVEVLGTVSDHATVGDRERTCDLGYLREPYRRPDGRLGYRCAAEPVEDYVAKGGDAEDTEGRRCLCNGLVASIGLGQTRRDGYVEPPLVTAGDDLTALRRYLRPDRAGYPAAAVLDELLGRVTDPSPAR